VNHPESNEPPASPAPELDLDDETPAPAPGYPPGFRCGFAAIVGRPNVGKSTLLNTLLGQKVSIVSPKPQTTRHRILGILNTQAAQIVFVDTPGLHTDERRMMNRYMNRSALASLSDADVNVFVVEALRWTEDDQRVLDDLERIGKPIILLVNKVDVVTPRERLLPYLEEVARRGDFVTIIPTSGKKGTNLTELSAAVAQHLPESPPHFPAEQVTDRSVRFQAAEIIREKLTWRLRQELPYGLTVEIERFQEEEDDRVLIGAVIWVERAGQKAIVIGQGGEGLKDVGTRARLDLMQLLGKRVHLELWVKVKENWSDSEAALRQFGYDAS
jgi:GTPase